jgi:hypothetical protein
MRPAEKEEAEMRQSKFSESQIVAILKEGEAGYAAWLHKNHYDLNLIVGGGS